MPDVTLAILAGGAGTRMGGPKSQLDIAGKPILDLLLDRIDWRGPTMLVTAPGTQSPPGSARFDTEVSDPAPGLGPLRGILTALETANTEVLVIATVDMPGITRAQLDWIVRSREKLALMFRRAERIEPFPSAWHRSGAPIVAEQLNQHRRAVQALAKLEGFETIEAPVDWPDEIWTNLNTPDDLRAFENRLEKL